MKVLHVINSLDGGGAEHALIRLIAEHSARGIESCVWPLLSGELVDQARAAGARIVRRPVSADLVHGWLYVGCVVASSIGHRAPVVWGLRHSPAVTPDLSSVSGESLTTRTCLQALRRSLSATVAVANSTTAFNSHRSLDLRAHNWRVITDAVDPRYHTPERMQGAALRRELGVSDDMPLFLQVGRVHPHKGQDRLIRATRLLRAAGRLQLLFVGHGVSQLPSEPGIHVLPAMANLLPAYSAADWFVSPARSESAPNALREAMASGLPVIATDVGDCASMVAGAGLLAGVPSGLDEFAAEEASIDALKAALSDALDMDANDVARLASVGRTRSLARSNTDVAADYADLYEQFMRPRL
ncbi:MAG: glycosyltransferase [Pseudomonadaceae bacterium]|nr:glycosyltransferase [Pseudomonadaceae bacterium]